MLRPLFLKGLICKLLKIKWSGRVDSNHRPPGPEPGEGPFCRILQVFADCPSSAVFFIFSMTSRVLALHWLAAVCRLSMHEKGKKRASFAKSLIPDSLVGTAVRYLVSVIKSQGGPNANGAVPPRSLRPARLGGQVGSSLKIIDQRFDGPSRTSRTFGRLPPGRHPGGRRLTAAAAVPSTCSLHCQCAGAKSHCGSPVCTAETVRYGYLKSGESLLNRRELREIISVRSG